MDTKMWQRALVRHLLRTELVIGTYTPCESRIVNGKLRYVPMDPKPGYYLAVISSADWEAIRDRRLAWSEHHGCKQRKPTVANVISRLARCPKCDRPMVMQRTDLPNQRYLTCMAWRESRTCSNEWVRFPEIEDVFVHDVRFLIRQCPQPALHVETRRAMLKAITKRLSHVRVRLGQERAAAGSLDVMNRPGRIWAAASEQEIEQLLAERYRLRADRNYWTDAALTLKLNTLRTAATAEPRDVARINLALRALLLKVVVDWEHSRLILHWRHGGTSQTEFWRRRQKGVMRNPTPVCGQLREASV